MPAPDNDTKTFLVQLRAVAKIMNHIKLSSELKIPVWQLRNWLYRDTPSPFVVRALAKTVSKQYERVRNRN